jgi:hypothetical protein
LALTVVEAQVGPQPFFYAGDVPTFPRAMIKLRVEKPQLMTFGTTTLTYLYQPAGRFQIQTSATSPDGGNPTRSGDENRLIASIATAYPTATWGFEYSSAVTVAVDADPLTPTTSVYHDPHYLARTRGTATTIAGLLDFWPASPAAGARDITGIFRVPTTEIATSVTSVTDWISGRQVLTVLGDMVQIEFILTNDSTTAHTVGLRLLIDAMFGGASTLDGEPIVLPDGRVLETEKTLPDPLNPSDALPDRWVCYDNPASPTVAVRGILNTSAVFDPGIATSSAGLPDQVTWGQMRNMAVPEQYWYVGNGAAPLTGEDWAYAVWWQPELLQPGESRRYVTYYGIGNSAGDYESPYAFMAYAPLSLVPHTGDDPGTPGVTESHYLTDELNRSPFPVQAYMDNFGTGPLLDASVRVRLPLGLDLAPGESLTKSAGTVNRNEVKSVSWNLLATASRPGLAEVRFTGPRGKVLTRQINIPAVPVLNPLPNAPRGLEMISIPYQFSNNDAEWVFQSLGSLLPGGPASLIRYDPQINDYRWFPDPRVTTVLPGLGFWLLNRNRDVVVLPPDAVPVDDTTVQALDLGVGWNQIGNPFTSSVRLDQLRVQGATGGDFSLQEAVDRNMLVPTVFAYDPEANEYTWVQTPSESFLDPYRGYWILIRRDLTLLFPPPSMFAPAQAPVATAAAAPGPNDWQVDLQVSAPGLQPTTRSLGVKANAETGLDQHDVPEPPASMRAQDVVLRSAFYGGESALGMPYLVDTRGPGATYQWNLVVSTNAINAPITVTWPSLEKLPRMLIATLVDEVTGQRRYMRTTNSYTFRTGEEPTERVLKVLVQPRPAQGLSLTGVSAAATAGGAAITYSLSTEAAVDIRIRNIAGVVIGQVVTDRLSAAGSNTVLWNGRSRRGLPVPAGRYLCEITARSPETGQATSVVQPLDLKR